MQFPFSKNKEPKEVDPIGRRRPKFNFKSLKGTGIVFSIIGFFVAIGVFILLVYFQNFFAKKIVYTNGVYYAKETIPERTIITHKNAEQYFGRKDIDQLIVPEKACTDPEAFEKLMGCYARVEITKGEIITMKDFEDTTAYSSIENYKDPVEVSVAVDSIADEVVGKVRAGDMVNISMLADLMSLGGGDSFYSSSINYDDFDMIDEEDESVQVDTESDSIEESVSSNSTELKTTGAEETLKHISFQQYTIPIMQNVYVTRAYTPEGELIQSGDTTTNAGMFVFTIERADEKAFLNAINNAEKVIITKIIKKDVKTADKQKANVLSNFDTPDVQEELERLRKERQEDYGEGQNMMEDDSENNLTDDNEYIGDADNPEYEDADAPQEEEQSESESNEGEVPPEEEGSAGDTIEGDLTPISDSEEILNQIEEGVD